MQSFKIICLYVFLHWISYIYTEERYRTGNQTQHARVPYQSLFGDNHQSQNISETWKNISRAFYWNLKSRLPPHWNGQKLLKLLLVFLL